MRGALHSAANPAWGTPPEVIAMAKAVLGGIDLDPCSSLAHNARIGAKVFFARDGAIRPYHGRVWINPPGGRGEAKEFWRQLMQCRQTIEHAIWLSYSMEQLQTLQMDALPSPIEFTLCVPRKRIRFVDENGEPGRSPTHGNAIIYVPGNRDCTGLFYDVFSSLGAVAVRRR